jgi:ribonuclease P protein component
MLKEENRLKKRKEFAYLYGHGTAKHTSNLTAVFLPTKNRKLKIGFSISKKIGKAHTRNLIKRRLRVVVREEVKHLPDEYNLVIIARAGVDELTFDELQAQVNQLLKKTGLYHVEGSN